jgi:cyclopropane fatty-acyl-phospholipid synthase-like methyltransferase
MTLSATMFDIYWFTGRLGWKDFIKRQDMYRYLEYPPALKHLQAKSGMKLLDIGSANSMLPVYLAAHGCHVLAIDC